MEKPYNRNDIANMIMYAARIVNILDDRLSPTEKLHSLDDLENELCELYPKPKDDDGRFSQDLPLWSKIIKEYYNAPLAEYNLHGVKQIAKKFMCEDHTYFFGEALLSQINTHESLKRRKTCPYCNR